MVLALSITGCGGSSNSGETKTETKTVTASSSTESTAPSTGASATTSAAANVDLPSLIPTPANVQQDKGPDPVADNGIHKYFEVGGSPSDAMNAYKALLEGKGWTLTVWHSGGGGGGGGATYSGTNGGAYGTFTGGGYGDTTYIQACAWPSKPANPQCGGDQ
jgi:hypothetical protein